MTQRARIPWFVFVVAIAAAGLHLMPYWHAQATTPDGWRFTGAHTQSPDYLQYRTWARQAAEMGPIVDNRFTSEPNRPYLPVFQYWAIGKIAQATGATPEFVYAYAGAPLAFLLTLAVYWIARRFLANDVQATWLLGAVLLGGGLGGHLYLIDASPLGSLHWAPARVIDGIHKAVMFEAQRQHYLIKVLFDTHFLLLWCCALAALVGFHAAVKRPSPARLIAASLAFSVVTLLHPYTGLTLVAAGGGVLLAFVLKQTAWRPAAVALACTTLAVLASLVWWYSIFRGSGLPLPRWDEPFILFSAVALGYPVAWLLIAWGGAEYWREADFDRVFLCGWAFGCLAVTLSSPFYPYPSRGTITLLPVLSLIGAGIYFRKRERVTMPAAVLLVLLLGATPSLELHRQWRATSFVENRPWSFTSEAHERVQEALHAEAGRDDLLLADYFDYRWLSPRYPGLSYHAHFFLTVDFPRKRSAVDRFYREPDPEQRAALLVDEKIRFLYVSAANDPAGFESLAGLEPVVREEIGTLFRVVPGELPTTTGSEKAAP